MYKDLEIRIPNEGKGSYQPIGVVRVVDLPNVYKTNPLVSHKSILDKESIAEIVKEDWNGDDYRIIINKASWFGKEGDLYILDSNNITKEDIENGFIELKPYNKGVGQ
ncbi:hypothetical protein P9X10_01135 [Bacillus cereus]|nr:hypothetical protein [Bacillus cereus]